MAIAEKSVELSDRQIESRFKRTVSAMLNTPPKSNKKKGVKPNKRISPGRGATPSA